CARGDYYGTLYW
nr:immunoglobulin heavy chain junction region [Mus musculus]MBK4195456.1 immunoglobulin heavy chain junction region [Mus musculus]